MIYWLFKKLMKRFIDEFEQEVNAELARGNKNVNPSWYWVQQLMFPKKEDK